MNKIAIMAAAAAVALMAAPSAANAQWYVGAGYTHFDFDVGDAEAITGRVGYKFNRNFAVEGEGSFGLDDEDDVELNHNVGAYAVGILPISDAFDVHGRVGYQSSEIDVPLGGADDDGVGYGVGATWHFTPAFGLRADYTRLVGDEGDDDAISLGGVVSF